ncbi:DUF1566 domain-containing protein [Sideroxydans sp. CL21]|uniref:Lcl C-terminal domain-containing protein n=1 Tax=Sideroxydans sp. CL21 TaxID=2600596 RepID=UPI0024BC876C|nr:DUF1566 domain-containing protein [Sideroxydans sp. CL21]
MGTLCIVKSLIRVAILAFAINSAFAAQKNQVNVSGKENLRYVVKADTAYDKKTDLTWQRCSVGQQWKQGAGCVGIIKQFTFDEAQQQGNEVWRVPSKEELSTLIDQKKAESNQRPAIDDTTFPDMDVRNLSYWSSTTDGVLGGWFVPFDGGAAYTSSITGTTLPVRLVRDGK